ncbi:MAG: hypothetical protein IPK85_26155 [Gemmatimonadetes bacterium]|nr:hypothetical protein [Gemmatimonadota bacterium]
MLARWAGRVGTLLATGIIAACIDITVDGDEIGSIEFVPYAYPSVNAGDTLRNPAGALAPLQARVFRNDGTVDEDAQVTFIALDTTVTISGSWLIGRPLGTAASATARIVAAIDGLQSSPRAIAVVPVPDSVVRDGTASVVDLRYSFPPATTDTVPTFGARVTRRNGSAVVGVPGYVVTFQVLKGSQAIVVTDTAGSYLLTDDAGRPSTVDTTDASGLASRRLVYRLRTGQPPRDTVRVLADVRRGSRIPRDSAVAWTVRVAPRGVTP